VLRLCRIASESNQKRPAGSYLSAATSLRINGGSHQSSTPTSVPSIRRRRTLTQGGNPDDTGNPLSNLNTNGTSYFENNKDTLTTEWYTEGPGRRVGYEDLTGIDWIFEYAKERQRLRILHSSAKGLLGHLRESVDGSQIWLVLILTGIATGLLAASIDVTSDWLGDLKTGFCTRGEGGGRFYLNKAFCCWGHDGW